MLSRAEQKALFDSLTGNLTINTLPDDSGDDLTIEIDVHWGFEPVEITRPSIIIQIMNQLTPVIETLGKAWGEDENGIYYGVVYRNILSVKIRAVDFGESVTGTFISKIDIANALLQRIHDQALMYWDNLIQNGCVEAGGIMGAQDVSEILNAVEHEKTIQFQIRIQKLHKSLPIETNIRYSTAPTLLAVESDVTLT